MRTINVFLGYQQNILKMCYRQDFFFQFFSEEYFDKLN